MNRNAWLRKNMLQPLRVGMALVAFCVPFCLSGCADKQAVDQQQATPPDPDAPSFTESALGVSGKERQIYSEEARTASPAAPEVSANPTSPASPAGSGTAGKAAPSAASPVQRSSHAPSLPPLAAAPLRIVSAGADVPPVKAEARKAVGQKAAGSEARTPKPAMQKAAAPKAVGEQGGSSPRNEQSAYKAALAAYEDRRYEQGEKAFDAFLRDYPGSKLAPNALYWKAECLYTRGRYPDAIYVFKEVTARFSKHPKAADALLKAGMSYDKMKDADNAKLHYRVLVEDYPNSQAARKARELGLIR